MRGTLIEIHISDIHFTAFDPKTQFQILEEQFLRPISEYEKIDIISVDGDLFDHKVMANSEGAMYASLFVDRLVSISKMKNAALLLLHGTYSHDANQLKLFYHYMNDPSIDIRIVNTIQFEYIKGAKILCIPELYGLDEAVYRNFLYGSGLYDSAFVHGTIEGAIMGNQVGNGRLFHIEDFSKCMGPIIAGHVHTAGCFSKYWYYCGSPYRWKFGEEQEKGFIVLVHDLDSQTYYVHFEPIQSFRYDTIYIDELVSNDPKSIIDYIDNLKQNENIDYIKVRFRIPITGANKTVISNYYKNSNTTFVEFLNLQDEQQYKAKEQLRNSEYDFILNDKLSDLDKFVMYVNHQEKDQFITVEKLRELLM